MTIDFRLPAAPAIALAIGALAVVLFGCESRRPRPDDGGAAEPDASSDAGLRDIQVQLVYETTCDGCAVVEHRIEGRNGDPLPDAPQAEVGLECEIGGTAVAPVLEWLTVQDRAIGAAPEQGIHIQDGGLVLGGRMTCGRGDFVLFDSGELTGDCRGLEAGGCQVLVNEFDEARGRLVLEIDCDALVPSGGGTPLHVRHGLLTIQGCLVRLDQI